MPDADEPELIRRAQQDRQAFGLLYDRYVQRIYAFACHRLGDSGLAQDLTAAAFEKALLGLGRFRWQGVSFGAWLYRIARNEIAQHFRRAHRQADELEWEVLERAPAAVLAPGPNGRHDALHAAFGLLSEADQELLTLRFFEGLDSAAVAEILGITVNNAYVRLHRALGRLRLELEKLEAEHV